MLCRARICFAQISVRRTCRTLLTTRSHHSLLRKRMTTSSSSSSQRMFSTTGNSDTGAPFGGGDTGGQMTVIQPGPSEDIFLENTQGLRTGQLVERKEDDEEVLEIMRRRLRNRISKEFAEMAEIDTISDDNGYAEYVNELAIRLLPITPYGWLYGRYHVANYTVTFSFSMQCDGRHIGMTEEQMMIQENPDRALVPDTIGTHDHSFIVDIDDNEKPGVSLRIHCVADADGYLALKDAEVLSVKNKERQTVKVFTQKLLDENLPVSQAEHVIQRINPNVMKFEEFDDKLDKRMEDFLGALKIDNRLASFVHMHAHRMESDTFKKNLMDLRDFVKKPQP